MAINVVTATFGSLRKASTQPINYQYDEVQILKIEGLHLPTYYGVDFCNKGDPTTITMVGSAAGVQIPDQFLATGREIRAYIVITEGDSVQTRYEVIIPVNRRPSRTDIQPTPSEQLQIDVLLEKMNEAAAGFFKVTPGTTTYAQITAARQDKRIPYFFNDGMLYLFSENGGAPGFDYYFVHTPPDGNSIKVCTVNSSSQWTMNSTVTIHQVYPVNFSTDTYSTVKAAMTAGKLPVLTKDSVTYYCVMESSTPSGMQLEFVAPLWNGVVYCYELNASDGWSDRLDHYEPHGIPSGGSTGQVLAKSSNSDYQADWVTPPQPQTGTDPKMDGTASPGTSTDYARADHRHPSDTSKIDMPSGGSTGQVLKKTASGVEWANESGGGGATEIYWATYGTTTSAEIEAAYQAGKVVKMKYSVLLGSEHIYTMTFRFGATYHVFISEGGASRIEISCNNDTWGLPVEYDLSNATPQALGAASAGSSTDYSRADHVHAMPSASDVGAIEAPATGTAGQVLKKTASGVEWANESGGGGSVSPYTSNPAALGTASPGSSDDYARGDHVHPKPTASDLGITIPSASSATPQALGTASAGSSTDYARADHVHKKPTASDLGIIVPSPAILAPSDPASSASVGSSTKYAREDHVHKMQTVPSAAATTPSPLGTADVGASSKYARADHVHAMPTAANVGAIAAPSSPSAGDVLTYDSDDGWIAQAPSGGGSSWTTVTDADLSEDVANISVTNISAQEIVVWFYGRINDASDSLANATASVCVDINGTKVQQGSYAYIRGSGTNFLTLFNYKVLAGTTWGFANVYGNNSGQASLGGQGGKKDATAITAFRLWFATSGHLFKSGGHVTIAYR